MDEEKGLSFQDAKASGNPTAVDLERSNTRQSRDGFQSHNLSRTPTESSILRSNSDEKVRFKRPTLASVIPIRYRTLSIHVTETQQAQLKPANAPLAKEIAESDLHKIPVNEVFLRFSTSILEGLGLDQATKRLQQNGKNAITPARTNYLRKIASYLFGGFGALLWLASLICWISWQPLGLPNPDPLNLALAILLLIVVAIQAAFNAWQDWSTARVMASINNMLPAETMVLRGGKKLKLAATELVTGDIVFLNLGNKVPADIRLVQISGDLKFDRSILTGESDAVAGSTECTDENFLETKNIALMGTHVTNGSGIGVVIATGDNTVMGRIAKLSSASSNSSTTLQIEIRRFVIIIASLSLTTGAICLIVWKVWLSVSYPTFLPLTGILINVIGVIVAYVPEGLPVAVTLCLTLIAHRMQKNKVLCKVLTTVETLGSVNVLCSDKTGTLTENKMFVTNASLLDRELTPQQFYDTMHTKDEPEALRASLRQLNLCAALCNAASFDPTTLDYPLSKRKINGDATDSAILRFAEHLGSVESEFDLFERVYELPFNSKNKFMISVQRPRNEDAAKLFSPKDSKHLTLLVKGAPDILLPRCTYVLDPESGEDRVFDDALKEKITGVQSRWSDNGQRVILLARRNFSPSVLPTDIDSNHSAFGDKIMELNQELTVLGLVGIVDPPREEIPEVVRICRGAGIRFYMVTGDFAGTAAAIARQIGIITNPPTKTHTIENLDPNLPPERVTRYDPRDPNAPVTSLVLTGPDLITLNEKQWEQVAQYTEVVFARTTPEQKLRIVREFQKRGNIVGMTGDGVNDSPSLKAADVGIAIGGGSDVAMEAADMVLLDKFSSIVYAIECGRLVFDNLKKVIMYLLPAGSWSELWPVLINVFLGIPAPLSTFLMICICVLTDMLPSIALMKEQPESDLLQRLPRNPKRDRLVNFRLLLHAYGWIGLMEMLLSMCMYFLYLQTEGGIGFRDIVFAFDKYDEGFMGKSKAELDDLKNTGQCVYFVTLVILQFGNVLAIRTRRLSLLQASPLAKRTRNLYLFAAMVGSLCIALLITLLPFFNNVFGTRPVPVRHWLIPIALAIGIVLMDEMRKLLARTFKDSWIAKIAW
ncbi:uncharacterized protein VTP21DRAFT_10543 [Calcarisporiella thermophila]|uniref:uncharacterized protein n=1 Tax=Calcarisporiella thermophila TaxID=911321 RepID=UPI0037442BD7